MSASPIDHWPDASAPSTEARRRRLRFRVELVGSLLEQRDRRASSRAEVVRPGGLERSGRRGRSRRAARGRRPAARGSAPGRAARRPRRRRGRARRPRRRRTAVRSARGCASAAVVVVGDGGARQRSSPPALLERPRRARGGAPRARPAAGRRRRLAQQRVPEAEALVASVTDDLARRPPRAAPRGPRSGPMPRPRSASSPSSARPATASSRSRRARQDSLSRSDPQQQRVAQASAAARRGRRPRRRAAPRRTAGCPRCARRAAPATRVLGRVAEDVGELVGELVTVEALELDPRGAAGRLELGEQRPQRVAAVQLVGAIGGDDEHPLAAQVARQVDEERPGRAVGPVQVLDPEKQRARPRRGGEQREERVEEASLRLLASVRSASADGSPSSGCEPGELARADSVSRSKTGSSAGRGAASRPRALRTEARRRRARCTRRRATRAPASARRSSSSRSSRVLPTPGLAGDEHERRTPRRRPSVLARAPPARLAPDEACGADPRAHRSSIAA